jgi:hypothetical protein
MHLHEGDTISFKHGITTHDANIGLHPLPLEN